MPLVAIDRETGARVNILETEDPRKELKSGELLCPFCQGPMIVRAGLIRIPHFAHYSQCTSELDRHPESLEHLLGKAELARKLRKALSEYGRVEIDLEVPIPEAGRVADILVTFPMGWRVAHEVQLSPVTVEVLQERTRDYLGAGIDVQWWLGGKAATPANRAFCREYFGTVLTIAFGGEEEGISPEDRSPEYNLLY